MVIRWFKHDRQILKTKIGLEGQYWNAQVAGAAWPNRFNSPAVWQVRFFNSLFECLDHFMSNPWKLSQQWPTFIPWLTDNFTSGWREKGANVPTHHVWSLKRISIPHGLWSDIYIYFFISCLKVPNAEKRNKLSQQKEFLGMDCWVFLIKFQPVKRLHVSKPIWPNALISQIPINYVTRRVTYKHIWTINYLPHLKVLLKAVQIKYI